MFNSARLFLGGVDVGEASNLIVGVTMKDRETQEQYFEANGAAGGKKFWAITRKGSELHIRFGKVGTKGSHKVHANPTEASADIVMDSLIRSKTNKGYVLVNRSAPEPKETQLSSRSSFAEPLVPFRDERFADPPVSAPVFSSIDLDNVGLDFTASGGIQRSELVGDVMVGCVIVQVTKSSQVPE